MSRRGAFVRQPARDSPKKHDQVDKQLEQLQKKAEKLEATRRKADDFFRKTTAALEVSSPQVSGDRKPPAEDVVQWVRLMSFDEHLLNPSYLFQLLGATSPSIDAATMAELVMGQYELARPRGEEKWLREARQWATMFFPI
ncbi:MAG: hypothetical protein AB2693_23225, partial [Candidatus Thiodiazotropha sp.]